jgi:hypothetical protein
MIGNEKNALVVQERDLRLFRELSVLWVADREQIQIVAGFQSRTRANERLLRLTRAALLRRFFVGTEGVGRKALYALSVKGAALAQVPYRGPRRRQDHTLVADFSIEHQLTVNRVYCTLKCKPIPFPGVTFRSWKAFKHPVAKGFSLIPDGYVVLDTTAGPIAAFLEVDLGTESLRIWQEKVRQYMRFAASGEYQREFGDAPYRVCVIAHSARRMHSIREFVAKSTGKIFWFTSLDEIERAGFFGSIWFRPHGDQPQGFIPQP